MYSYFVMNWILKKIINASATKSMDLFYVCRTYPKTSFLGDIHGFY